MAFYGSSIIFDDVQSELYDLKIYYFDVSGTTDSPVGGDSTIHEEWIYRRDTPYFYGRSYNNSLEFDFTLGSYSLIDGNTRHAIEKWLLGRSTYLPLRIVQDDISDTVFNVIITKSSHKYIGNLNYAIDLHAKCDRPWGVHVEPLLTKSYTYTGSPISDSFNYVNSSVYDGYNRPLITFTMDSSASSTNYFSLINNSDTSGSSAREFRFSGLLPSEVMTIDNDRGIISSSGSFLRMDKFNKNFFRLVPGVNNISLSGNVTNFTLSSTIGKGVGT